MHRIRLVAMCGALLLGGCAAQATYSLQQIGEQLPVGSWFEIAAPFSYPAGRDTLWFQDGAIVSSRALNLWTWHCSLDIHLSGRSDAARRYENGGFLVSGITEDHGEAWLDAPVTRFGLLNDDIDYTVTVEFSLASPEHPEIKALRCARRFQDWSRERSLALVDVRGQVGEFLAIRPANRQN